MKLWLRREKVWDLAAEETDIVCMHEVGVALSVELFGHV